MVVNSRAQRSEEKKEYLKLSVFAVNPDNVWGAKLRRLKGLSLAEMGTFGKSARPCMYNFVHYTEFHLLSPGSESREI